MKQNEVFIQGIATEVPPLQFDQERALAFALRHLDNAEEHSGFIKRIFRNAGIHTRHTVLQGYAKEQDGFDFYPESINSQPAPSTRQRNQLFVDEATKIVIHVVDKLFSPTEAKEHVGAHRVAPSDITHLITVSCTGFSAPGIDLALQKHCLRAEVNRTNIGFMGCYAMFPALKLARSICLAHASAKVLIVSVELCSLHFQQRFEPDAVVASALFSDGATAMLVTATRQDAIDDRPIFALHDFAGCVLDNTEQDMAWVIGDTGFEMYLSSYVPKAVGANITPVVDASLARVGIQRGDISHWAIHPGGRAILDRVCENLQLQQTDLQSSYRVLNNFGNMSSATIGFVLADIAVQSNVRHVFAAAFGPGLTVESAVLSRCAA